MEMNDLPRQKLCEIVINYDRTVSDNPKRCKGFLLDFCGKYRREVVVLVDAIREGIPAELLKSQQTTPHEILLTRLATQLQDNLALTEEAARWAVESWGLALGIISRAECRSTFSESHSVQERTLEQAGAQATSTDKTMRSSPLEEDKVQMQWNGSQTQISQETPIIVSSQPIQITTSRKQGDWHKATIIGALIGISILIGFVLTRSPTLPPYSSTLAPRSTSTTPQSPASTVENPTTYPTVPISEPISPATPQGSTITSQEAKELVLKWLSSKQVMMSPPYNRKIAAEITTGKQYRDTITAIDWLEANNAYWQYFSQNISSVYQFNVDDNRATIQVKVIESLVYYQNGKRDDNRSGVKTTIVTYRLQFVDVSWKIAASEIE